MSFQSYFLINLFILLFYFIFFGCIGLHCCAWAFLWLWRAGFSLLWFLLLRSMGSRHVGFRSCGTWAQQLWVTGSRAQAQQLWRTGLPAPRHVGSSRTRARTHVPCIGRQILNHCATREATFQSFLIVYISLPRISAFLFVSRVLIFIILIIQVLSSLPSLPVVILFRVLKYLLLVLCSELLIVISGREATVGLLYVGPKTTLKQNKQWDAHLVKRQPHVRVHHSAYKPIIAFSELLLIRCYEKPEVYNLTVKQKTKTLGVGLLWLSRG